jgi:Peptidase family M28
MVRYLCPFLSASLVMLVVFPTASYGRQEVVSAPVPATQSQKLGLDEITEGRVTATISFLASDELAGRATGSDEFNIAARYVASRFRGAGLDGKLTDGDYFHVTMKPMVKTPSTPVRLADADSKPIAQFGLLAAGPEILNYKGMVKPVDLASELPASGLEGVVGGVLATNLKGARLISQIARMTNTLHEAGAKALLLGVSNDSELIQTSREYQEKPRSESSRGKFAIPVVLVPESTLASASIQLEVPAAIVSESPMRNVIGLLEGTDPELSKEAILFSAHLDHLGSKPMAGDGIFNGADDDASGVTAVVMLADAFAKMPRPKRSLLFMTFWGEESGLLGSKQFAETPAWPLDQIRANVNIEMIGRPESGARNKIWMTGWQESDLGSVMNKASLPFGVEIFEHPKFSAMLYRQSDNWSFAQKGVIAHSFSAGSLHSDYHQVDDEWDRLEIPHMTRVIQGLFVGSLPIAYGEATPNKPNKK